MPLDGTAGDPSKHLGVIAPLLAALLFAATTPAPAPRPAPTNPFNLEPIPAPSNLPYIGGTRAKPVCTAIRSAVKPAVEAAMKNDDTFGVLRTKIFDYVIKETETTRDLRLMQMDRTVDQMVKYIDTLNDAAKSPALEPNSTTKPDDAKTLRDLKHAVQALAIAEKTQLEAMSGFVETERMRRFGQLNESEQNLARAMVPTVTGANGDLPTPMPVSPFLRDTKNTVLSQHATVTTLSDAHHLDRDLGDIVAFTNRIEKIATGVIVPAANSCK